MITVYIDDTPCLANEGEYILNIARRNNIFIPAICYLNGCSPTLACRLCVVDIEGKRAYACNAKAKDGMRVVTKNSDLEAERKAIMGIYCVNHPLECGVCDQSGECELQNYTLLMGIKEQPYAIKDTHKKALSWGKIHYDPSLCIVCERCITVCKDKIGESALKTVARGGDALDKELKDSMPKDAYAMWNKMQKSLIAPSNGESLECSECGECTAVCPVGALVGSDFQYKANAWEFRRIPASNPHSSDCALMYYDVKHTSINDNKEKIYRVSNDFHFMALNPAARYGYDFENNTTCKDEKKFNELVEKFNNGVIKSIIFDSFITNEEALILQKIKEKFGLKLINHDAKRYQEFLDGFSKSSGKTLYNANYESISNSDFLICVGTQIKNDAPNLGYAFNNAMAMNKGAGVYFHPLGDSVVKGYGKNILCVQNKPLSEEAVLFWVLSRFGENLPSELKEYLDGFKKSITQDVNEVVKEQVVDENGESKEVEKTITKQVEVVQNTLWEQIGVQNFDKEVEALLAKKSKFSLIVGEDLYRNPNAKNLSRLLGLIERYTPFEVMPTPSKTNTLGVSLICELDEKSEGYTLGYNVKADFTLSALGKGDLDIPSLNQQEGTFVSFDRRVVPTNVALGFNGYCLNDIANALGLNEKYTINYTSKLPLTSGFKTVEFDALPNRYENDGTQNRGYELTQKSVSVSDEFEKLNSTCVLDGEVVYLSNPIHQFSPFTAKAHELNEAGAFYVSSEFLEHFGVSDGGMVTIKNDKTSFAISVKLDRTLGGLIGYLPTFDTKISAQEIFSDYRFAKVCFEGVNHG